MSEAYPELREGGESPSEVLDCRDIEGTVCYCDPEAEAELRRRIAASGSHFIKWIDSGDFHYLTRLTTSGIARPYCLVLFDHHPDMQPAALGGILSCGGWLRTLLEEDEWLFKAIIIGINPQLVEETEGFGPRVEVFTENDLDSELLWPIGLPAYISIDKDVLSREFARTDWDQGTMTQERLFSLLKSIFRATSVLGVDICGELTGAKGGREDDRRINRQFNKDLFNFINNCI